MENKLGRRLSILLILIISIFPPMSTDMYLSGLPQMIIDFGTNESTLNMSLYMFMLTLAISILFIGPLSDKFGRRKVLIISMTIYVIASIGCCLALNVWMFIAMRMIQAIGGGGAMAGTYALIKDLFEGKDMKFVLSTVAALGIIGPILAPVLGTVLINLIGWQATFWVPATLAVVCIIMLWWIPKEIPINRYKGKISDSMKNVFRVMKEKDFTLFMLMMCTFSGAQLSYIAVSSYIYQGKYGLTTTEYSLALAAVCVFGLIVSLTIRRIRMKNIQMIAILLSLGLTSLIMMTFLGGLNWVLFLISMIPCCAITITTRVFGFGLLLGHHDGDNGSVSSALNFTTFMFITLGMLVSSSFPPDLFIYGISTMLVVSCSVYTISWILLKRDGYKIKNLKDW